MKRTDEEILESTENIDKDFKEISKIAKELLTNTRTYISNGAEICEDFYKSLLNDSLDEASDLAYLVSLEKINSVFHELFTDEDTEKIVFLKEAIPVFRLRLSELRKDLSDMDEEFQEEILIKINNLHKNNSQLFIQEKEKEVELVVSDEPISKEDEFEEASLLGIETLCENIKPIQEDKAFSVEYAASMANIECSDVIIAESKKEAIKIILEKIFDTLEVNILSIKEEDV